MSESDLSIIKQKIFDEDRIQDIYEAMGAEHITFSGGRIEAQLPDKFGSNNKRALQTKLTESLNSYIRNRPDFGGGDIFSLISYVVHGKHGEDEYKKDLYEAKKFICETLGWTQFLKGGEFKTKNDYVAPLKALLKGERKKREIIPNVVLPDDIMNQFYIKGKPIPYDGWIKEGISYNTQVLYGVGFDWESHRIVYPLKNRFGQIVGVKGRIMRNEDDPERKYIYIYRCNNRYEWFNLHYSLPYIISEKKVYVFEAEKSCMKAFEYGIYNTLAIGASDMSPEQVDILKQIGLDIEIILCYDKGITMDEIKGQAKLFNGREVYAMYDIKKLLGKKDSPIDCGVEIWNELVDDCIFEIDFEEGE